MAEWMPRYWTVAIKTSRRSDPANRAIHDLCSLAERMPRLPYRSMLVSFKANEHRDLVLHWPHDLHNLAVTNWYGSDLMAPRPFDPLELAHALAPYDDEPFTREDQAAADAGWSEYQRGEFSPLEEVRLRLLGAEGEEHRTAV